MTCLELEAHLDLVPLGTLEPEAAALVEAHVASCAPCKEKQRALGAAYATLDALVAKDAKALPAELRAKLVSAESALCAGCAGTFASKARVFSELESAWYHMECFVKKHGAPATAVVKPAAPVKLSLRCSYCHEDLQRGAAAYCASCLAPHHADCFREHGRCSALGCGETRLVPPEATVEAGQHPRVLTRPAARSHALRWMVAASLTVLGCGGLLGVRFYVEKIQASYDAKTRPVDVACAARDLRQGDVITKRDIVIQIYPHGIVDALQGSYYPANETDKFEGARLAVAIKQGQVFQPYHFRQTR